MSRFEIIQLKHPFINGCFRFQVYVYILTYMYIHSESTSQIPLLDWGIDYANQGSLCLRYFFQLEEVGHKICLYGIFGIFYMGSQTSAKIMFFLCFFVVCLVFKSTLLDAFMKFLVLSKTCDFCSWNKTTTCGMWGVHVFRMAGLGWFQKYTDTDDPKHPQHPPPPKKITTTSPTCGFQNGSRWWNNVFLGSMARPWVEKVKYIYIYIFTNPMVILVAFNSMLVKG